MDTPEEIEIWEKALNTQVDSDYKLALRNEDLSNRFLERYKDDPRFVPLMEKVIRNPLAPSWVRNNYLDKYRKPNGTRTDCN